MTPPPADPTTGEALSEEEVQAHSVMGMVLNYLRNRRRRPEERRGILAMQGWHAVSIPPPHGGYTGAAREVTPYNPPPGPPPTGPGGGSKHFDPGDRSLW